MPKTTEQPEPKPSVKEWNPKPRTVKEQARFMIDERKAEYERRVEMSKLAAKSKARRDAYRLAGYREPVVVEDIDCEGDENGAARD